MSKNIIQKIVVAAVILHKNKVLLLQRSEKETFPGLWELPSGRRESLESSVQAIKREVREETGLTVEVMAPIITFEYFVKKDNFIKDTTQINFLTKVKGECKVR